MTRFGMKEEDFQEFAGMFTEAVRGRNVADEVARFRERFQTMNYCFDVDFSEYKNHLTGLF
jgi:glycine/serine hydroxymethyltransferase